MFLVVLIFHSSTLLHFATKCKQLKHSQNSITPTRQLCVFRRRHAKYLAKRAIEVARRAEACHVGNFGKCPFAVGLQFHGSYDALVVEIGGDADVLPTKKVIECAWPAKPPKIQGKLEELIL